MSSINYNLTHLINLNVEASFTNTLPFIYKRRIPKEKWKKTHLTNEKEKEFIKLIFTC